MPRSEAKKKEYNDTRKKKRHADKAKAEADAAAARVPSEGPSGDSEWEGMYHELKGRYYLRVEPMILLKNAKEAAIPGRSEGGIALRCTTKYLPPTAPIDLWPPSATPDPWASKNSPRACFVQNQLF